MQFTSEFLNSEINNILLNSDDIQIEATYSDAVNCFNDLSKKSSIIVRAVVDDIVESTSITQLAAVSIKEIYQGNVEGTIYVCQIKDDNAVKKGESYILFLNPQSTEINNDKYYCVGGGIGAVKLDYDYKVITPEQSRIIDSDFEKWLSQNTSFSDWIVKSQEN